MKQLLWTFFNVTAGAMIPILFWIYCTQPLNAGSTVKLRRTEVQNIWVFELDQHEYVMVWKNFGSGVTHKADCHAPSH